MAYTHKVYIHWRDPAFQQMEISISFEDKSVILEQFEKSDFINITSAGGNSIKIRTDDVRAVRVVKKS